MEWNILAIPMNVSDYKGHAPNAGLSFKMRFFVQLCSSVSRGPSAMAELLVLCACGSLFFLLTN